jgi:hypothetical protein
MVSYLLTSATAEDLKALLRRAGLEILTEGGPAEVARFIGSETGRAQDPLALICLLDSQHDLTSSVLAVEGVTDTLTES